MTGKQRVFVSEYLVDRNGTRAAIRAGYSPHSAHDTAHTLLNKAEIQIELQRAEALQFARAELTTGRILEELRRLATIDGRSFFNEDGSLKRPTEWSAEQGACVASFDVIVKNAAAGDGHTDTVARVKLWDKSKALEMLSKHLGLLIERVEHQGALQVSWLREEVAIDVTPVKALPASPDNKSGT